MKVYVAMVVEPDGHSMIGCYSNLNEAERARSPQNEIANVIYECTVRRIQRVAPDTEQAV